MKLRILALCVLLLAPLYGCGGGGGSTPVDTPVDTTSPDTPLNLTAQPVSASQINLAWSASSDNVAVSGYEIYENNALLAETSELVNSDVGLTENTQFCYTIAAFDAAGNVSNQSASVCATTPVADPGDTTAPSVPTDLGATSVTSSQINLAWTASTDDVGVSSYLIYRDGSLLATRGSNSLQDAGLSAGTSYCYRVTAQDAAGNVSAQSVQFCTQTSQANTNASLVRHLQGIGSLAGLVARQI
jgi:chitodextrinase